MSEPAVMIRGSIWDHPGFYNLSAVGKLIFFYVLVPAARKNCAGIARITPDEYALRAANKGKPPSRRAILSALTELEESGLIWIDRNDWIVTAVGYADDYPPDNPKHLKGIVRYLKHLKNSPVGEKVVESFRRVCEKRGMLSEFDALINSELGRWGIQTSRETSPLTRDTRYEIRDTKDLPGIVKLSQERIVKRELLDSKHPVKIYFDWLGKKGFDVGSADEWFAEVKHIGPELALANLICAGEKSDVKNPTLYAKSVIQKGDGLKVLDEYLARAKKAFREWETEVGTALGLNRCPPV